MKTIHKYPVQFNNESVCKIKLPINAKVLTVDFRDDKLCLWARVNDAEEQIEEREFRIYATDEEVNEFDLEYIATVQESWLVWHIFENKS